MERKIINSKLLTSGWFSLGFLVSPPPFTVLAVLGILTGIRTIAIFLVDRWLTNRTGHFLSTFVFSICLCDP
jgi:hypothetical protein